MNCIFVFLGKNQDTIIVQFLHSLNSQHTYACSIKILHYILALLYSNRGDSVMIEYATTAEELSGVEIGKPSVRPAAALTPRPCS